MHVVLFTHSLVSDWNHGNAHFVRGVARQLKRLGCTLRILERANNWSVQNLRQDHGEAAVDAYREAYPELSSETYRLADAEDDTADPMCPSLLDKLLAGANLILFHEWNDPRLCGQIGRWHAGHPRPAGGRACLFHDTHHRLITKPNEIQQYDLAHYDGVLAFGDVLAERYRDAGLTDRAWTWHEAADTVTFHPLPDSPAWGDKPWDLVWVGNWGDDERTAELHEFLLEPASRLGLRVKVHGVRYPHHAKAALQQAGITYGGYLPNHRAPDALAEARLTVHVPRRPYVEALPGIPTIRPFEAMACGVPLVCSPWDDAEGLFHPSDYRTAADGHEMQQHLSDLLDHPEMAAAQADKALQTIRDHHTCQHRAVQLLEIVEELGVTTPRMNLDA